METGPVQFSGCERYCGRLHIDWAVLVPLGFVVMVYITWMKPVVTHGYIPVDVTTQWNWYTQSVLLRQYWNRCYALCGMRTNCHSIHETKKHSREKHVWPSGRGVNMGCGFWSILIFLSNEVSVARQEWEPSGVRAASYSAVTTHLSVAYLTTLSVTYTTRPCHSWGG
jgi:hypothetical protein